MLTFIYLAYLMMASLYETAPTFEDTWVECLGDLGKYRMAIEDEDFRDSETWTAVPRRWYSMDKVPTTGRLHHHLAILARPEVTPQITYYSKRLCIAVPLLGKRQHLRPCRPHTRQHSGPGSPLARTSLSWSFSLRQQEPAGYRFILYRGSHYFTTPHATDTAGEGPGSKLAYQPRPTDVIWRMFSLRSTIHSLGCRGSQTEREAFAASSNCALVWRFRGKHREQHQYMHKYIPRLLANEDNRDPTMFGREHRGSLKIFRNLAMSQGKPQHPNACLSCRSLDQETVHYRRAHHVARFRVRRRVSMMQLDL